MYNGNVVASGGSFGSIESTSFGNCIVDVVGCMNSSASNYDPLANTSIAYGGIVDPTIASGTYFAGNQYLIFDAYSETNIVSADVYAQSSNTITFELRDSNGSVLDDTTITVAGGQERLYFDFDVPIGTDYQFGINSGNSGLYRSNDQANVNYPYNIGGLIEITESSASVADQYYYFFYNIEVEAVCTGVNNAVLGCTDPSACNYDPNADTDDGSCLTAYGCTDVNAFNYDANATCDDGSCIPVITGCTDPAAFNYNSNVNTDDGSCLYAGCTDPLADNYDPTANYDDGSCIYSGICNEDAPTGLFTSDIVHTRATINWDNMNSSSCTVDQYRIRYRELGTNSWSTKTMGAPVGSCAFGSQKTDKLLLNLTASTTYEYEMKAWYCGGGNSAWTATNLFTTLDNCPNVGNLAAVGATPTKATLTWDASNGVYAFVRMKARVDSISSPTGSDFFQIGGAGVSYGTYAKDKNGLVPGETYRGQARTYCDPNGGAWKSVSWSPLVYWTQPTQRIDGGEAITNLDVYPNPSRDRFNISFTSETVQDLRVRVLNVVGEEIVSEDLQEFVGEYTKQINLEDNAKGIYFLEIETGDGIINKKLILQ